MLRSGQAALSQDHHHDGRRRGRLAYPHAAAHLLLSSDAASSSSAATSSSPSRRSTRSRAASRSNISRTSARWRTISSAPGSKMRCCGFHSGEHRAGEDLRRWSSRRAPSATCSMGCTAATIARWSSRPRSPVCSIPTFSATRRRQPTRRNTSHGASMRSPRRPSAAGRVPSRKAKASASSAPCAA